MFRQKKALINSGNNETNSSKTSEISGGCLDKKKQWLKVQIVKQIQRKTVEFLSV